MTPISIIWLSQHHQTVLIKALEFLKPERNCFCLHWFYYCRQKDYFFFKPPYWIYFFIKQIFQKKAENISIKCKTISVRIQNTILTKLRQWMRYLRNTINILIHCRHFNDPIQHFQSLKSNKNILLEGRGLI